MIQPIPSLILIILLELALITAYNRQRKGIHAGFAWISLALLCAFNFLWIYITALAFEIGSLFIILPLAIISLFFHWIQSGNIKQRNSIYSILFLMILWVVGLILSANISYDNELGSNLFFVSLAFLLIALMIHWPQSHGKEKEKNTSIIITSTKRISFIALLFLSYIVPYVGYFIYFNSQLFCAWQIEGLAAPIIDAIELYKTENDTYPYYLSQLVPNYLEESEIPQKGCHIPIIFEPELHLFLDNCNEGQYVSLYAVGYPTTAYSFRTKDWEILDFNIHPCGLIEGLG